MSTENFVEGRKGEWMQVASGGKFFPQDPRPEEIKIDDIANGLALTCRYGGQGAINNFYSVAEHSLHMAEYALKGTLLKGYPSYVSFALAALMHDAAEAYAGDLIRAIKSIVKDSYQPLEDGIQTAIMKKYGLLEDSLLWAKEVKEIDNRIIVNEKAYLFGFTQDWASDTLCPLPGIKIRCYDPSTAKKMFLILFWKLIAGKSCSL